MAQRECILKSFQKFSCWIICTAFLHERIARIGISEELYRFNVVTAAVPYGAPYITCFEIKQQVPTDQKFLPAEKFLVYKDNITEDIQIHNLKKMDWRQSEIYDLIHFYEQNICLWDYQDQDYKNQVIRNKAWAKLANYFDKDVDEIKKKIKHLRNSYLTEKKKVNKMKTRKVPYEPHLFYYNYMTFLDPVQVARVLPENGEERQSNVRPTTKTITHNGSFESPKRKRSYSSDNLEQDMVLEVDDEPEQQADEIEVEINMPNKRSALKDSPKRSSRIQITKAPIIPLPATGQIRFQSVTSPRPLPSKEDTFCAMICSELRLLKSEETYDNVTAEIYIALKNAKAADRRLLANP